MGKLFLYQTKLRIIRTVNQNLTEAKSVKIKYIKPSKKTGEWNATILDNDIGSIYYDVPVSSPAVIDEIGEWITWAFVTFSDDRSANGEIVKMMIHKPGT